MKRSRVVYVRLSDAEHATLMASLPPGDEIGPWARRALLSAAGQVPESAVGADVRIQPGHE